MVWCGLGCFNRLHDRYANSRVNSQTSLARVIGGPTDFTNSLLRAVGQPTIFGTPLVVRQRTKNSLSTAERFGQNLNLMYVLHKVYTVYTAGHGRP